MSIDYKKHYDDMLKSGMFFEWNPNLSGDWETDRHKWVEKYGESIQQKLTPIDYKGDLEHIIKRLEHIIDALERAIEGGNDLHLGIVVGQTLIGLKDIARN